MKIFFILSFILLFFFGCGVNTLQNEDSADKIIDELSDHISKNADLNKQEMYDYLNQQRATIYYNFREKIRIDYHDYLGSAEAIKTGSYIQNKYSFVFSTSTGEVGLPQDILKIYKDNKEIKTYTEYSLIDLIKINHNNTNYYRLVEYTGGAHCCYVDHPFVIKDENIIFGAPVKFGNVGGLLNDNTFVKDNLLYFYAYDDRLSYFYSSFVDSAIMWFPRFYIFDHNTGNYLDVSDNFRGYYNDMAEEIDIIIEQIKEESSYNLTPNDWLPWLVARSTYQLMAGQDEEEVKRKFMFDHMVSETLYFWGDEDQYDARAVWQDLIKKLNS